MYEKDYLKRVIQQAAYFAGRKIAQILGLIEEKDYLDALEQLNGAFMDFYGMDTMMLKMLTAEAIIDNLTGDKEEPDAARLLVLAELLKLEGDAFLGKDKLDEAQSSYTAALDLYLEIAAQTGYTESRTENQNVDLLAKFIKKDGIALGMQIRLMRYYHSDRQYGKAEDELHEMIDLGNLSEDVLQVGLDFYEALLKLEDEELERGEILREEVLEGSKELRDLKDNI